jgi:hypothetical protein
MDPNYFEGSWIQIRSEKLDPDPQNSKDLEAQNGAVDAHNGGREARNGALEGLFLQWLEIRITLMRIRIRIKIRGDNRLEK